jgi:hypothetical protein
LTIFVSPKLLVLAKSTIGIKEVAAAAPNVAAVMIQQLAVPGVNRARTH